MNLKQLIEQAMAQVGDTWANVEATTLTDAQLSTGIEPHPCCPGLAYQTSDWDTDEPFGVWTRDYIYAPADGQGILEVMAVPRNPGKPFIFEHT
jgi:hypothetical protein